jgi:hypothetical protein
MTATIIVILMKRYNITVKILSINVGSSNGFENNYCSKSIFEFFENSIDDKNRISSISIISWDYFL